ncbi:MAG: J domain-containing protein [Thiomonas sp.]|nr:J domain-containing protein [Thiomonas sp.]
MSVPAITLQPPVPGKPLSKQQKAFNTLVSKIHRARNRLQQWHDAMQRAAQAQAAQIDPKMRGLNVMRKELLLALDGMQADPRYNKTDHKRLRAMIDALGHACLSIQHDAEIEAILNRQRAPAPEQQESGMDDLFGFDKFSQTNTQETQEADAPEVDGFDAETDDSAGFHQRHLNDVEKRPRDAQAPSLRAIYRKLASALHPDRESDPEERARKTALLQRANKSYKNGDLLALLGLQLEIAMVDAAHLSALDDAQIKDYARALKTQLAGLEEEITLIEHELHLNMPFAASAGKLDPRAIDTLIEDELDALERVEGELKSVLSRKAEVRFMKSWLREQERASQALAEESWDEALAAFEDFLAEELSPRRRRRR